MSARRLELALWLSSAAMAAAAYAGWTRAVPAVPRAAVAAAATPRAVAWTDADTLAHATLTAVAGDPFRLERRPASVAYSPELEGMPLPPPPPPKPPKPRLVLAGILGGPPWEALLEGVPGREGSVLVRAGDVLTAGSAGTLTVREISRATAVVAGADTVWKLTLKRTWQ